MPWMSTDPVNERLRFIAAHQSGLYSMTELCLRSGVSRETGYEWLARYEAEGLDGLKDRSHAPHSCPHRMPVPIQTLLLATRRAHPSWGPKKIRAYLLAREPSLALPACSTIGDLLKREGLTQARRRRRSWTHPGEVPLVTSVPNEVWSADFKGHFRLQDGTYCYPLTVKDAHSRFLLGVDALSSTKQIEARPVFERLFREYGLPAAMRTDNGVPFSTQAVAGLSKLSVWWIKLGIQHDRIEPASPEQNGRHERMHRTLKAETTRPPKRNQEEQQARFDQFRDEYNCERPHEALGQKTPASEYARSGREMPKRVPQPEYPGHFLVRKVNKMGAFRFKGHQPFISDALIHEHVGLEETADGVWSLYFYNVLLGRISERDFKLRG